MSLSWKLYWLSLLFMCLFYPISGVIAVGIFFTIMAFVFNFPLSFAFFGLNICLFGSMHFNLFDLFRAFVVIAFFFGEKAFQQKAQYEQRIKDAPISKSESSDENYHTVDDIEGS